MTCQVVLRPSFFIDSFTILFLNLRSRSRRMLPPASALLFLNRFQIRWWAALRNSIPEVYNNHPIIEESFLIRQRVISVIIINRCVQDKQCGWNLVNNHVHRRVVFCFMISREFSFRTKFLLQPGAVHLNLPLRSLATIISCCLALYSCYTIWTDRLISRLRCGSMT